VIGALTPDQQRLVWDTIQQVRSSGILTAGGIVRDRVLANSVPIYVKNESGEEIPAYGCMKVTGTAEPDGQNYLEVVKPDSDFDATFLINGPNAIEDDGRGIAQASSILRILTDGETITNGHQWGPVDGEWYIDKAASTKLFRAVGGDSVAVDVARFVLLDSGDPVSYTHLRAHET